MVAEVSQPPLSCFFCGTNSKVEYLLYTERVGCSSHSFRTNAGVAQWQCFSFVMRGLQVQLLSPAPLDFKKELTEALETKVLTSECRTTWLVHLLWEQTVGGSNPSTPTINFFGGITQLVECLLCKQNVASSILTTSTILSLWGVMTCARTVQVPLRNE